jgi:hypothetical protein
MEEVPVESPDAEELKKKIAEMQSELEQMAGYKKKQEEKMAEVEAKFSKAISELTDVVVGLIQTPSAEPTESNKQNFNKAVPSKDSRISSFLSKYARN